MKKGRKTGVFQYDSGGECSLKNSTLCIFLVLKTYQSGVAKKISLGSKLGKLSIERPTPIHNLRYFEHPEVFLIDLEKCSHLSNAFPVETAGFGKWS